MFCILLFCDNRDRFLLQQNNKLQVVRGHVLFLFLHIIIIAKGGLSCSGNNPGVCVCIPRVLVYMLLFDVL